MRDEDKTRQQLMDELVELRRQVAELRTQASERKRSTQRPVRVGEVLIGMGVLTKEQLDNALRNQREADMRGESHVPVGNILAGSGVITRQQLQMALTEQRRRLGR